MKLCARDITLYAVLIAAALVLSLVESWLPAAVIPIPGIKLGLANIVTLFAVYTLGARHAAFILLGRCILASLFGGGITAFAFSVCGGMLALLAMCVVKKLPFTSVYGVSIAGAAAHGIGQIAAAMLLLSSSAVVYYLPFLLIAGVFTGALTALISSFLIPSLKSYV